ncbi:MAG: TusE/DsrC/DsvC family sulfur relay protein [candidate division NC10 bacterium]
MPKVELEGKVMELDEDGFLQNPDLWTQTVAQYFADQEEIGKLTDEHWKVVNMIRNYYLQFGVAPMIRKVVKDTGFELKHIYTLFPSGPAKGACKVAGLPKPTGCV